MPKWVGQALLEQALYRPRTTVNRSTVKIERAGKFTIAQYLRNRCNVGVFGPNDVHGVWLPIWVQMS